MVTSLSLEFGFSSISPLPLERFSLDLSQMFASVRWCAEPITQLCWLKVKVTIEGHQFEPWILRALHCHSDRLVVFGSNVCLSEMACRTYNSTMQTEGQGHNWRSSISFLFAPYLLIFHIMIFMKLWSNVCLSEAMFRTHNSSMPTQGQGHS